MKLLPTQSRDELKKLFEPVIELNDGKFRILNQKEELDFLLKQLAVNALFAEDSIKQTSQKGIWQISQFMGTPYATGEKIFSSMLKDHIDPFKIPVINSVYVPFEILETVFDACNEMEVGPILFHVDNTDPMVKGFISFVLAAAVKKRFQAPVLFYYGVAPLPFETTLINWQDIIYFNKLKLPPSEISPIRESLANRDFTQLADDDWKKNILLDSEIWEPFKEEFYTYLCDSFEDGDSNETFQLIKRYLIPTYHKIPFENI
ncbi:MAG: hypothetical protein JXR91_06590 [Deltaproteobacteria bacterium]|nr:hypothetical protein [Deltaproteobacteria bacterium]